ncbi:hypothetical protein [Rhodococcus erythropolis]|uniref:hypothetical protein n=1 Tax=Rhodococcus erythropolis TaxID=1833 RepID=UPI0024B64FF3|nr:hypothetical protein [Rhodococcus erythropolis]MDJ0013362.1 hypothetical protein [Rhodococcus erythropolis]
MVGVAVVVGVAVDVGIAVGVGTDAVVVIPAVFSAAVVSAAVVSAAVVSAAVVEEVVDDGGSLTEVGVGLTARAANPVGRLSGVTGYVALPIPHWAVARLNVTFVVPSICAPRIAKAAIERLTLSVDCAVVAVDVRVLTSLMFVY